jgi:PAS domain-containing protein
MGVKLGLLTLSKEHRLRITENRRLRRIFGLERDEVIGGWRKLRNEDLHNLYFLPSTSRMIKSRMRRAGYVVRMRRRGIHICY